MIDDPDLTRYVLLKNSILYLIKSEGPRKELGGKAINIFDDELKELKNKLQSKGYILDEGVCVTGLDIPLIYIEDEKGEIEEQGRKVKEIEAVLPKRLIENNLPLIIREIKSTPIKPMLDK